MELIPFEFLLTDLDASLLGALLNRKYFLTWSKKHKSITHIYGTFVNQASPFTCKVLPCVNMIAFFNY